MATIAGTEIKVDQRSEAWYEVRLGKATGSRFKDVLASIRSGGEAAARRNYRSELVVERLTGKSVDRFKTPAMDYGAETEELARTVYTLKTGNDVTDSGFWHHLTLQTGASPDGLIRNDGCLELKCRTIANHVEALRTGKIPKEYLPQIYGQLWLTGRTWCDFCSFAPELSENAQLFIQRIYRDEGYITMLEKEITAFLTEVDTELALVQGYKLVLPPEKRPTVKDTPRAKKALTAAAA